MSGLKNFWRNHPGWFIASILVVFVAIGAALDSDEESGGDEPPAKTMPAAGATEQPDEPVEDEPVEITAEMIVDVMSARDIRQACRGARALGYDLSFSYFRTGFTGEGDISAREAYDEILSRC